jgi:predicted lipid-binding transport protein (Tim44 family)
VTSIIIFALAAVFLGLRLFAVLGKREGHEQSFAQPEEKTVPPIITPKAKEEKRKRAIEQELGEPVEAHDSAVAGIRAISAADRNFSLDHFVEGAGDAYRLILEAYWQNKLAEVEAFMSSDVRDAFAEAIEAREAAGERLDNRLIAIERAMISGAALNGRMASVTVRFDAVVAAVTRNAKDEVIAGSLSDGVPTHDVWTFSRDVKVKDPNWILTDTDEAA